MHGFGRRNGYRAHTRFMETTRELKPLRTLPKHVEGSCYNHARLALHRLGSPLRIALSIHRGLEVILENDFWICVDSMRGDLPVMEWQAFETQKRDALHEPVACILHLYHLHAGLIMGSVPDELERILKARLAKAAPGTGKD